MVGRVALGRTSAASVLADYERLLRSIDQPLSASHSVHIHIILTHRLPYPGSSAVPWQTEAILLLLQQYGYTQISYSLSQPDARDLHGHRSVLHSFASKPIVETPSPQPDQLVIMLASLQYNPDSPALLGLIPKEWSITGRNKPTYIILDGTTIGIPAFPQVGNLLLASTDHAALESVAAALFRTSFTSEAMRLIDIVGDTELLMQRFMVPQLTAFELFALHYIPLFMHNQHLALREQRVYTSWLYDTQWGQLFRSYQLRRAIQGAQ